LIDKKLKKNLYPSAITLRGMGMTPPLHALVTTYSYFSFTSIVSKKPDKPLVGLIKVYISQAVFQG